MIHIFCPKQVVIIVYDDQSLPLNNQIFLIIIRIYRIYNCLLKHHMRINADVFPSKL